MTEDPAWSQREIRSTLERSNPPLTLLRAADCVAGTGIRRGVRRRWKRKERKGLWHGQVSSDGDLHLRLHLRLHPYPATEVHTSSPANATPPPTVAPLSVNNDGGWDRGSRQPVKARVCPACGMRDLRAGGRDTRITRARMTRCKNCHCVHITGFTLKDLQCRNISPLER